MPITIGPGAVFCMKLKAHGPVEFGRLLSWRQDALFQEAPKPATIEAKALVRIFAKCLVVKIDGKLISKDNWENTLNDSWSMSDSEVKGFASGWLKTDEGRMLKETYISALEDKGPSNDNQARVVQQIVEANASALKEQMNHVLSHFKGASSVLQEGLQKKLQSMTQPFQALIDAQDKMKAIMSSVPRFDLTTPFPPSVPALDYKLRLPTTVHQEPIVMPDFNQPLKRPEIAYLERISGATEESAKTALNITPSFPGTHYLNHSPRPLNRAAPAVRVIPVFSGDTLLKSQPPPAESRGACDPRHSGG